MDRPPKKYLVRDNCEYSLEVEAESAEKAMELASKIPHSDWSQAWAPREVEEPEDEAPVIRPTELEHSFGAPYYMGSGERPIRDQRPHEAMVGVRAEGQDWERAGEDLYRALVTCGRVPSDILTHARKPLLEVCQAAAQTVDWHLNGPLWFLFAWERG